MPYIKQEERKKFRGILKMLELNIQMDHIPAGELNYFITKILLQYLGEQPNYQRFNDVMGILNCMDKEFYRRMMVDYEKIKKEQNGDVF